jgi:hypothetical protein
LKQQRPAPVSIYNIGQGNRTNLQKPVFRESLEEW